MIYTVTLNPALDYTVFLDDLQQGSVCRTKREMLFFGGKGINVSAVLAALGEPTVALGFVAGFTGEALLSALDEAKVANEFIRLPAGQTRINVKIKAAVETDVNATGPEITKEALRALFLKLDALKSGDTLVLSGSVPPSVPRDIYLQMMDAVAGRDVRVAVDAEGELLLEALKRRPFVIKPNHHELAALVGRELCGKDDLLAAARELQKKGARHVLVSRGKDGALLLTESGEVYEAPAVGGKPVNTVGAGDSTLAGFLCGLNRGYAHALHLAVSAGGATACKEGLATAEDIAKLLRELS